MLDASFFRNFQASRAATLRMTQSFPWALWAVRPPQPPLSPPTGPHPPPPAPQCRAAGPRGAAGAPGASGARALRAGGHTARRAAASALPPETFKWSGLSSAQRTTLSNCFPFYSQAGSWESLSVHFQPSRGGGGAGGEGRSSRSLRLHLARGAARAPGSGRGEQRRWAPQQRAAGPPGAPRWSEYPRAALSAHCPALGMLPWRPRQQADAGSGPSPGWVFHFSPVCTPGVSIAAAAGAGAKG